MSRALAQPEPNFEFATEVVSDLSDRHLVPWRVLLVDDDPDVHQATLYAIGRHSFSGRPIEFFHAYSADQARTMMPAIEDLAFILLDVVMESETAGLELVSFIRDTAGLSHTRIVLRTGQPGYAPELETILRLDINDYKAKAELTQTKLLTLFTTTLRAYQQLRAIENNKQGLTTIVKASSSFMKARNLNAFSEGVLSKLRELLGGEPEGFVCGRPQRQALDYMLLAASGRFAHQRMQPLHLLEPGDVRARIMQVLQNGRNDSGPDYLSLHFGSKGDLDMGAYIDTRNALNLPDPELINVFCANLGAYLQNQSLIEQLHQQAFSDELLNIPNRAKLIAEIDKELARGEPNLAVCIVDVDDFSSINELMGHRYGDELLRSLSNQVQMVVGSEVMIARVSGNAFGLLGDTSKVRPEILRSCLVQPILVDERPHRVTVTCGYVALNDSARSGADYLKNATIALKLAKKTARGHHVAYTADLGLEARNRAQMLADLHTAFDLKHLYVVYQPQIDLLTGELIGLEALMRWRKPDGMMVPPDHFIPVAEQSGLIVAMGDWVLLQACSDMQRLIALDLAPHHVAVNVSLEQFKSPDFYVSVIDALQVTGLPFNRLELEITESVAMLGPGHVSRQLSRLRAQQVAVSIDDFGTGYSSLSHLEQLPLDRMKIDKAFVRLIGENDKTRIADMIAELGTTMGLRVLAEGIEDQASWNALLKMGCHEGQGFFIGKPMEMVALVPWIKHYRENHQGKVFDT